MVRSLMLERLSNVNEKQQSLVELQAQNTFIL
jgi:hypothetical protein